MNLYKRKIVIDYRNYFIQYSDGSQIPYFDEDGITEKIDSGLTFSAITGPESYILVNLNQKTKDLGIYSDIRNEEFDREEGINIGTELGRIEQDSIGNRN